MWFRHWLPHEVSKHLIRVRVRVRGYHVVRAINPSLDHSTPSHITTNINKTNSHLNFLTPPPPRESLNSDDQQFHLIATKRTITFDLSSLKKTNERGHQHMTLDTCPGLFMHLLCNVCSRLNIHKEVRDKTKLFIIYVLYTFLFDHNWRPICMVRYNY